MAPTWADYFPTIASDGSPQLSEVIISCKNSAIRRCEKRLIKEKKGVDAELEREGPSWMSDVVLEYSRAPDLVCKILERERASETDGTEEVDSATKGQSPLPSGLRQIQRNAAIERSDPRSTHETGWGAG
jgi:hypothetical protein